MAGTDYASASGTLTFNPGDTSKTVAVTVYGDATAQGNRTFSLNLSNPINASVRDGQGTGLIVDEDGYIISSAFNFIQQPSSILVTLPGGKRTAARIVARDKSRMLVLLKVSASDKLPVPAAVPRSEMTVGQWAIAVGRTYD